MAIKHKLFICHFQVRVNWRWRGTSLPNATVAELIEIRFLSIVPKWFSFQNNLFDQVHIVSKMLAIPRAFVCNSSLFVHVRIFFGNWFVFC